MDQRQIRQRGRKGEHVQVPRRHLRIAEREHGKYDASAEYAGGDLAEPVRVYHDPAAQQEHAAKDHQQFLGRRQGAQPDERGLPLADADAHERHNGQQFVRERVEELADVADPVVAPGQIPVENVRQKGKDKDGEGGDGPPLQEQAGKNPDHYDPQRGQYVRYMPHQYPMSSTYSVRTAGAAGAAGSAFSACGTAAAGAACSGSAAARSFASRASKNFMATCGKSA